jgi:hypothetical protein
VYGAVFPENARCHCLFVFGGRHPYGQSARLQVAGGSQKLLVFAADLSESAVDTSPQAVVLTGYIETFSPAGPGGARALNSTT